ncbi:MAG: hypothetical protein EBX98_08340, partial [Burkholderiaceae bacterium]|nr:hypothetical protein [Burkholderiaceae bacterium]
IASLTCCMVSDVAGWATMGFGFVARTFLRADLVLSDCFFDEVATGIELMYSLRWNIKYRLMK